MNIKSILTIASQNMKATILLFVLVMCSGFSLNAADNSSLRQAFDPELKLVLQNAIKSSESFEDKFEAQVWLTDMSNRMGTQIENKQERLYILSAVHREATKVGLQPELVLAVMEVESAFDRFAISRVGARGLMQIMPFWLDEIGRPNDNLFHIDTNIRFGCTILKYYIDLEKGNLFRALGRYNGSLGKAKYPDKVFYKLNRRWFVQ